MAIFYNKHLQGIPEQFTLLLQNDTKAAAFQFHKQDLMSGHISNDNFEFCTYLRKNKDLEEHLADMSVIDTIIEIILLKNYSKAEINFGKFKLVTGFSHSINIKSSAEEGGLSKLHVKFSGVFVKS